MTQVVVASLLLVASLLVSVVLSMWVETRLGSGARPSRPRATAPSPPELALHDPEPEPLEPEPLEPEPVATREDVLIAIAGRERADQLVGALFAAYVVSGGSAARRAAGWVTAVAESSLEGSQFRAGADLRGRTAPVRTLFLHDEADRCWVTLQTTVDIARGVGRHPVECPTLDGLVRLWHVTRSAMTSVPDGDVDSILASIDELAPTWRGTTAAPLIDPLAGALRAAFGAGDTVRIQVTRAQVGAEDHRTSRPSTPAAAPTV